MSIVGGGILFRLRAGGNAIGLTNTRSGAVGSYTLNTGTIASAAANLLRLSWADTNNDGVAETPTYLIEPAATNSLLQSQTWATAPWSTNLLTATNNVQPAPDGTTTASTLVPNNTSSNQHQDANGTITTTASENLAFSCFLKAAPYSGARLIISDGVSNDIKTSVDLTAGTIAAATGQGTGVLKGQSITALANGWFQVGMWGTVGTATSMTAIVKVFDNGSHAASDTAYAGDGVVGMRAWGAQFERNGTTKSFAPSSYIATTSATVTRSSDACSANFPYRPVALTIYVKYASNNFSSGGSTQPLLVQIGSTALVAPRAALVIDQTGSITMYHVPSASLVQASAGGSLPTAGQIVEARGVLNADGSVIAGQSIAGGTEVVSGTSAPLALAANWATTTIAIASASAAASTPTGLLNVLVLKGVRSMAACRILV